MLERFFLLLIFGSLPLAAAPKFIVPDETRPLVKRELLPLDVTTMHELGRHLTSIAGESGSGDASNLRQQAKLLALAQRLHPTLPKARHILEALAEERHKGSKKAGSEKTARRSLTRTATWLLDQPAGSEGHKLGLLILDILPPDGPLATRYNPANEAERWSHVIAPLAAFRNEDTHPEPEEPEAPTAPKEYLTTNLITKFPFIGFNLKTNEVETGLQPIILVINQDGDDLSFSPPFLDHPLAPLHRALRTFFRKSGNPLPLEHRLFVDTSGVRYDKINKENIATPLAMMLDAALTGNALRADTILFARLRADASLEVPEQSWGLLRALHKSPSPRGTRLIVPPSLEEQLKGLLTMEAADFFLKYDVLSASNFEEARQLFYQNSEPDPDLASALVPFNEVRQKAPSTNLGSYLVHKGVRTRLARAAQAPNYLSAKILQIQSEGNRPAHFTRKILARELHFHIHPLRSFRSLGRSERSTKAEHAQLRDTFEALNSKVDIDDRALINEALDLIKKLPSIAREMDEEFQQAEIREAIAELRETSSSLLNKLEEIFAKPGI